MIDITSDICPFCNSPLKLRPGNSKYQFCENREHIDIYYLKCGRANSKLHNYIAYYIKEIQFIYHFNDNDQPTRMVVIFTDSKLDLEIGSHIVATLDNYLQVIDRIKSLQVFQ